MATMAYTSSSLSAPHTKDGRCAAECNATSCPSKIEALGFAFARINGDVRLVQVSLSTLGTTSSALTAVEVRVFVHEFITIWRYSHCDTFHPSDIRILESIDDGCTLYEEENGTVFLARDVMERLQKITEKRGVGVRQRPSQNRWRR